jgi:hypothetical protein
MGGTVFPLHQYAFMAWCSGGVEAMELKGNLGAYHDVQNKEEFV